MDRKSAKAIVLNLGDGLTTSLSYLLPMVLFGGHFIAKAMLIGGVGGATSMAFNLDDSEDGEGSRIEFILAFISSLAGGILPVLPFIVLSEPWSGITATAIVLGGITTIWRVKCQSEKPRRALRQVAVSVLPALTIVGALSLLH